MSLLRKGVINPRRGFFDYCLGFNGDDRVSFGLWTDKTFNVTISLLFKTSDITKWYSETIFHVGKLWWEDGYALLAGGNPAPRNQRFAVTFRIGSPFWRCAWIEGMEWTPNKWHHIAIVLIYKSGTTIDTKFYLDGNLKATHSDGAMPTVSTESTIGFGAQKSYLGYNSKPSISTWLDEFRVWNRALTDNEIRSDRGRKTPDFEDLVLWVPMNEGKGTTIYDKSGQGNNGTITGTVWVRK